MKVRPGVAVALGAGLALLLGVWWLHGRAGAVSPGTPASARAQIAPGATAARAWRDPRGLARAAIRGTVRDEAGAPVAQARVCAAASSPDLSDDDTAELACTRSGADGGYQLTGLVAANYTVHAGAPRFRPAVFPTAPGARKPTFPLAPGERKTGVDLVLRSGGVEVTGTVLDIAGGPIVHAQVRATSGRRSGAWGPAVDTDEQGRFSLWVEPGTIGLAARADGYARSDAWGSAPGQFALLLTPESSLAGTVVDAATDQPIEGARVQLVADPGEPAGSAVTDAQGKFRIEHLIPARYAAIATAEHRYGRSTGSTLLGLGQHVDGMLVKLFPARRVSGEVRIAGTQKPCPDPQVALQIGRRGVTLRNAEDRMIADGVVPGTYTPAVYCQGYTPRDYAPVVVGDTDVTGVVWEVDAGATIRGRVATRAGEPVEGAEVLALYLRGPSSHGGFARDVSAADGSFTLTGLGTGSYRIEVQSERGGVAREAEPVELAAGATVERDLVLEDGGTVAGTVLDAAGAAVPGITIEARPTARTWRFGDDGVRSDLHGAFRIAGLRPGEYRIVAKQSWREPLRKPGTTDDAAQGELVTVRAAATVTVQLVVESRNGTITGSVVDAAGKPVSDAFVSSARESDAAGARGGSVMATRNDWWGDDSHPGLTATDGSFTLAELAPGTYTVRAYRRGGGEAIAEHVALGARVALRIGATGSIRGAVRRAGGSPPERFTVSLRDPTSGLTRSDTFYRTDGQFTLADLPAGHYDVTAESDGGQRTVTVALGEGQTRTDVDLVLDPLLTVTGRVIELGTQRPVSGMYVSASSAHHALVMSSDGNAITDASGRFTIARVPTGPIVLRGMNRDFGGDHAPLSATRTLSAAGASGTVDLGDLPVVRRRAKAGDPIGELGLRVAPASDSPAERELAIRWIDPAGPAAKTGLVVGDVITSCDGMDVTGDAASFLALIQAPPGTRLTLGTRRGVQAVIVLARP